MGILKRAPKPRLDPNDEGYRAIEFQFVPDRFIRNVASNWAEKSAFGRDHPVLQYVTQESETYSFRALLFAERTTDTISDKVEALIAAVRANATLKRPPLWTFSWGDFIIDTSVIIESVGGIEYGEPRANDTITGVIADRLYGALLGTGPGQQLRTVQFRMRLKHYEPFGIEIPSLADLDRDTFHHIVRTGDTWEELARLHYKEALKGDLLRRRNPSKEFLVGGQTVDVLKPSRFRGLTPTPYSIPLVRTTAASTMRRELFEDRRKSRVSHVL